MATPGESCTGLRVSPVGPAFLGYRAAGKSGIRLQTLTSGSKNASEQCSGRSSPCHLILVLAEPWPATGDFVICIKLVDRGPPTFSFLLSLPYTALWPGVQQVRARLATEMVFTESRSMLSTLAQLFRRLPAAHGVGGGDSIIPP